MISYLDLHDTVIALRLQVLELYNMPGGSDKSGDSSKGLAWVTRFLGERLHEPRISYFW